jgi:hypothetical protein
MGFFVQMLGQTGYARGVLVFIALAAICLALALTLKANAHRHSPNLWQVGKVKVA